MFKPLQKLSAQDQSLLLPILIKISQLIDNTQIITIEAEDEEDGEENL